MKTTYWTTSDYLTLKRDNIQINLRLDGADPLNVARCTVSDLDATIHRLQRQRGLLGQFLVGEAVENPSALRV